MNERNGKNVASFFVNQQVDNGTPSAMYPKCTLRYPQAMMPTIQTKNIVLPDDQISRAQILTTK